MFTPVMYRSKKGIVKARKLGMKPVSRGKSWAVRKYLALSRIPVEMEDGCKERYLLSNKGLRRSHEHDPALRVPPVEVVHDHGRDESFAQTGRKRHLWNN